eukprot:7547469-Alexandrium_andersonii.AAC.1
MPDQPDPRHPPDWPHCLRCLACAAANSPDAPKQLNGPPASHVFPSSADQAPFRSLLVLKGGQQ